MWNTEVVQNENEGRHLKTLVTLKILAEKKTWAVSFNLYFILYG